MFLFEGRVLECNSLDKTICLLNFRTDCWLLSSLWIHNHLDVIIETWLNEHSYLAISFGVVHLYTTRFIGFEDEATEGHEIYTEALMLSFMVFMVRYVSDLFLF